MLEGAGFEVFDLGINTDVDEFLAALDEHQPDILGHVGAAHHDDAVHEGRDRHARSPRAIRDDYIVLVGGAPLNEEFGAAIGADAYCRDAAVAAETAKALVAAPAGAGAEPTGPSVARRCRSCSACGALAARPARRARPTASTPHVDVELPAGQPAQPARAHRAGAAAALADGRRRRAAGVRRLRRLRHRRRARRAGSPSSPARRGCRARTATRCSPARALFARAARRRARHLLPHRLPRQALRRARVAAGSASTVIPSCATRTSAHYRRVVLLSQARRRRRRDARARAAADRLGLDIRAPADRSRSGCGVAGRSAFVDAAPGARMPRRGSGARRHLLARHPGPGQRAARAREAPGGAARAGSSARSTRPRWSPGKNTAQRVRRRVAPHDEPSRAGDDRRPRGRGRGRRAPFDADVPQGAARRARRQRRLGSRRERAAVP